MRRLLMLAAVIATPAAWANDLGQPVTAMIYWQQPFGATEKRDSASTFGFRLDRTPIMSSEVLRKPIVDVRFNERGFHSFAFRGSVLHQNQPASGEPAPEINWWLIGGAVAVGTAIIVHEERKLKMQTTQQTTQTCTNVVIGGVPQTICN